MGKKLSERVADAWGVPKDVIMDMPRITVTGDREIYIENYRGIAGFDENSISVSSGIGRVTVYGDKLEIAAVRREDILISGRFKKIEYEVKNVK